MTREVTIYAINETPNDVVYSNSDISHGNFSNEGEPATVIYGMNNPNFKPEGQLLCSLEKTVGALYGVTGTVTYELPQNSGQLVLTFNNPYTQEGSGSNGNCWLYPLIQNINATAPVRYSTAVTGFTMTVNPPAMTPTITATVAIQSLDYNS